jgi:plasmid stabilization system protein ParE
MYQAILLPLAKEDIRKARRWYNGKQSGLGKRFTTQVREKVQFIRRNPKGAPIRYDEVRTAVVDVFPFMIHYTVDDAQQQVIVTGVFHTSQDPESWDR